MVRKVFSPTLFLELLRQLQPGAFQQTYSAWQDFEEYVEKFKKTVFTFQTSLNFKVQDINVFQTHKSLPNSNKPKPDTKICFIDN